MRASLSRMEKHDRFAQVATIVLTLAIVATFLKNAWVCDDAYITFRSVEQLAAGHGPRWNPHERVQVFTSPLWFGLLAVVRALSANVFLNAIALAGLMTAAAMLVLRRALRGTNTWCVAAAIALASNAYFDYTTSGLENPLAFLLLTAFVVVAARPKAETERLAVLTGLILLCRLDLLALIAIPFGLALFRSRESLPTTRIRRTIVLAFAPAASWALFSLLYYGAPLPNPAYAKLGTGIAEAELLTRGVAYLAQTVWRDPVTAAVLVTGMVVMWRSRRGELKALSLGVVLNLCYVASVGGDFMMGRFVSFAFVVCLAGIAIAMDGMGIRAGRLATLLCLGLAVALPHTPLNSAPGYAASPPHPRGIADERGVYNSASLWRYATRPHDVFPDTEWSHEGIEFRSRVECCAVRWSVGFYAFHAGLEKKVLDRFALCDPVLARLPIALGPEWRVGHYARDLPDGFVAAYSGYTERISDPQMREFVGLVRLITQGDRLFARERLRAIVTLNLGLYNHPRTI